MKLVIPAGDFVCDAAHSRKDSILVNLFPRDQNLSLCQVDRRYCVADSQPSSRAELLASVEWRRVSASCDTALFIGASMAVSCRLEHGALVPVSQ